MSSIDERAFMDYIPAKTIVTRTRNDSWFGTDYNMNIYKGCCHGCIYCDSRSECYHVEDFDTVRAKANALDIIRRDLVSKTRKGVVGTGAMSDPYNPYEQELGLTRGALGLLDIYGFGVVLSTKSDLVVRDANLLQKIKSHSPVLCNLTITAADDALCRIIEPYAPPSSKRFAAIAELSKRGITCGVLLMPILPLVTDSAENILAVVRLAREAGAAHIYPWFGVTLRANQRDYYFARLDEAFPGLKSRYGKFYDGAYTCQSPAARELRALFTAECQRLGIRYHMNDIVSGFKSGHRREQLSLL